MKKIIVCVVVLLSLFTSVFGFETKYDSFGAHFSVPLTFEKASESGITTKSNMTSIAFGIHALSLYTEKIGLYVNMDLIFPQKIKSTISYNGSSVTYDLSRSNYQSLWGLSSLLAPCFCISHTDKMLFTVSPGIHYTMLVAKALSSSVTYAIGIGANVQDSIFFSTNGYFMFGADLAYDFLGATILNGDSNSGTISDFIINPRIGIGFRFK